MSIGNKLQQTVLVGILAEEWRASSGPKFARYFDTLENADPVEADPLGTWPVIEDQFIDLVGTTPACNGPALQIKMDITFRDPWLSVLRCKHVCLIDIGLKSNNAIVSVRSPAGTLATMLKPRYIEVTSGDFSEVCNTLIEMVDDLREEYRINFNGKRLSHWYKQSSLIWDTCQAVKLPDSKHFIEHKSKQKSNPDNAVITFYGRPTYAVRTLVERVLDILLHNAPNACVTRQFGDMDLIDSLIKTLIFKKQMKFGAFVKYMTQEI